MQKREGRSCAPPPSRTRERADVARPGPLDPPADMIGALEPPEALHAAELLGLLPQAARRDLQAGLGEGGR